MKEGFIPAVPADIGDGVFLEGRSAALPSKCKHKLCLCAAYKQLKVFPRFLAGMPGFILKSTALALLGMGLLCANACADDDPSTEAIMTDQTPQSSPMQAQVQGEAFLKANKNKPGVVTLPDGLQYKVLIKGKGALPTDTDIVTVDYAGRLINGTEFDSSYQRGQPASFPVNGVIPGWVEALKLMKVGSTWELFIPASLAYGEQGAPPSIGSNETLIFKVHLISIQQ